MATDIRDSLFISKYTGEMTSIMRKIYPKLSKKTIKEEIVKMVDDKLKNPTVTLDNNYTHENQEGTLLGVFDWAIDRKPIIAGNGTFYKPQHEAMNPIANMLDDFLTTRQALKKRMFTIDDPGSWLYKDLDRSQGNEKQNVNSYYGASGARSSAFYSKWSGPATTGGAQSVISTAEQMFEALLVDNYVYLDITELMHWCECVVDQYKEREIILDNWIVRVEKDDLVERLRSKIMLPDFTDEDIISKYCDSLDPDIITYMYYKNNLAEFIINHKEISSLFISILTDANKDKLVRLKDGDVLPKDLAEEFKTIKNYNKLVDKESFLDPNDPPVSISGYLETLNTYIMKYVYMEYISFDKIYRIKNFVRGCVTTIDTDSNFLSLDTLVNFLLDNVIKGQTFGREKMINTFIIINTITYIITNCASSIFLLYGEYANIDEEFRPRFNMKNEFLILRLIIAKTKKRYLSLVYLREGNLLPKPKLNVTGFDFKKSACSEAAEKVYMGIVKKYLMDPAQVDIGGMYQALQRFAEEVRSSILNNEKKYLPIAAAKELAAYSDPGSEQSVRGVITWNLLNPDNLIDLPSKVNMVKLNIFNPEALEPIRESHPYEYETLISKVFNDQTGIFVSYKEFPIVVDYVNPNDKKWNDKLPKKYRSKFKKLGAKAWNDFVDTYDGPNPRPADEQFEIKSKGVQCIAIPSNDNIPDYLIQFIDVTTMVNNILGPFNSVLEIFGLQAIEEGKTHNGVNRKTPRYSNIIKF